MKRQQWSADQLAKLRLLYPDLMAGTVAREVGHSLSSVYQKARQIGLEKSDAFKKSQQSGRIQRGRQDPRMLATQIKPGNMPWNKGKPGSTGLHPNCRRTQFKAGMKPEDSANYKPIGSLRVTKDGYLERKVTDDRKIAPSRRWVAVARLVWIAAHGPLPRGHIVVFRPGMKTLAEADITIDRLECISRAENARRNHPRSKSPELAKLVQLKGAINRQVNRITREAQEQNP